MTDNEKVIEELQSAAQWFELHGKNTNTAIIGICKRAVAEINHQKAEIDEKNEIINAQADTIFLYERALKDKTAEIENLQFSVQQLSGFLTSAKAETIKEYNEKVKQNLIKRGFYPVIVKNALKEVEKEMVGD